MRNIRNTKADHASHSQRGLAAPVVAFIFLLIALSARAADITVTTTADVVNGDVTNPTALMTNPGPDGISLREAILAANNALGPHTITFADELAGQTIAISSQLIVTQNGIALTGLSTLEGQPNISIDASNNCPECEGPHTFLPAATALEKEAVQHAVSVKYKNIQINILRPEYLTAIFLRVYRLKDREKIVRLLEQTEIDKKLLSDILARYDLKEKFKNFTGER